MEIDENLNYLKLTETEAKKRRSSGIARILDGEGNTRYLGQLKQGNLTGMGKMKWWSGTYHGYVIGGEPWGTGNFVCSSSDLRYIGHWQKGLWHGQGIFAGAGMFGVGSFKENRLEGLVLSRAKPEDTSYFGQMKLGKMDGFGIHLKDGLIYEGYFKQNSREGVGIECSLKRGDTQEYHGEFSENNFHGFGRWYIADSLYYEGHWREGSIRGPGVLYTDAGTVSGDFENSNTCFGKATFNYADGNEETAYFKNGKIFSAE